MRKFIEKASGATAALAVAASSFVAIAPARAADPAFCQQYASLAVHEATVLSTLACFRGFDGMWHLDFNRHYNWCLTTEPATANGQRDYRRMRIAQCGG
jgi:hypothetical protein